MTDNLRIFLTALAALMQKHNVQLETDGSSYSTVCAVSLEPFIAGDGDVASLGDWVTFEDVLQLLEDVQ
jgi:hypothetical protein